MRVRFMLLTIEQANRLPFRFAGIASRLGKFFSSLPNTLKLAHLPVDANTYLAASLISAGMYSLFSFILVAVLSTFTSGDVVQGLRFGFVTGLSIGIGMFLLHMYYPRILAKQNASGIDQGLMFALRSMQVQVNSGVSLYDAMANIAQSNYSIISEEFEKVIQEINAGVNEGAALERLALRTESEFLRKTVWQLVTNIRTGSPMSVALQSIMETLTEYQSRAIKSYAAELNMWILMYLLIAAALPTIGITFMIILSSIGGSSISQDTIFLTLGAAFVIQIILIGLIGSRTPKGY
ncbi:MAG: type II secretion system F family protein [Candidatus Diapherotrites archaeon]|uniref:Type II secretion system F family protein n=1 Tax=Candidatus Iainarchaeum sp. TaxID=3101447 RepID=A0A8T4C6P4_9ARCH|nr:type II secretion system F family protein [Candidatus Diapherotrites archaeon]